VPTFFAGKIFHLANSIERRDGEKNNIDFKRKEVCVMIMDRIALILSIVGALNWGSIGLFKFDIVAWIFGGQDALLSRIIYTVVALAGIWCISLLFRSREEYRENV
jgi:uncharacterized membrane protein YuzA (DUF378 family)